MSMLRNLARPLRLVPSQVKSGGPLVGLGGGRTRIIPAGDLLPRGLSGKPLTVRDWSPEDAIRDGVKGNVNIYRGLDTISKSLASVPLKVSTRKGTEWTVLETHPLLTLLKRPNPRMSGRRVLRLIVYSLYIAGNSLERKILLSRAMSGARFPAVGALWPLAPVGWSPIPVQGEDYLSGYRYDRDGVRKDFTVEEILHIQFDDPSNPFWGMSPLQPASRVMSTQNAALEWNKNAMENRSVSDLALISKVPIVDDVEYTELRRKIRESHQGGDNAREPWVLGSDFDIRELGSTPVEMDFTSSLNEYRKDNLSSLAVPPVLAGYFDDATLANAETSVSMFWEGTIVPLAELIAEEFQQSLIPHFGDPDTLSVNFDFDQVPALKGALEKRMRIFVGFLRVGVPYNQALSLVDLDLDPIVPEGDKPFGISAEAARAQFAGPSAGAGAAESGGGGSAQPAAAPAPPSGQTVEVSTASVLNGAQISAATAIVAQVAAGEIPRDSGLGQLIVLFNLTQQQAEQIMGSAGTGAATTPNVNPGAAPEPPKEPTPPNAGKMPVPKEPDDDGMMPEDKALAVEIRKRIAAKAEADPGALEFDVTGDNENLMREMERLSRELRLKLLFAIRAAVTDDGLASIAAALLTATSAEFASLLGLTKLEAAILPVLKDGMLAAMESGGSLAAKALSDAGIEFVLDRAAARQVAIEYAERFAQLLTDSSRKGVDLLMGVFRAGGYGEAAAEDVARVLRGSFGANGNHYRSIDFAWRHAVEKGGTGAERELVANLLQYAKESAVKRVEAVADNEAVRALHQGQLQAWRQAKGEGKVKAVRKTWVDNDDMIVCPICSGLDGKTVDVDNTFVHDGSEYDSPPGPHPWCRCGLLLEIEDAIGAGDGEEAAA